MSVPEDEDFYNHLRDHIKEELEKPTTLVILDGLDERARVSEFLSEHKYEAQYGRTISFIAGEVSQKLSNKTQTAQRSKSESL